jgi:hypothetical protein
MNTFQADARARHGAVLTIRARAAAARPILFRLAPCGAAEVCFVDKAGRPLPVDPWLEVVIRPRQGKGPRSVAEEALVLGAPRRWGASGPPLRPDRHGRLDLRALIPGATYRLRVFDKHQPERVLAEKEFTVKANQRVRLGEMAIPPGK